RPPAVRLFLSRAQERASFRTLPSANCNRRHRFRLHRGGEIWQGFRACKGPTQSEDFWSSSHPTTPGRTSAVLRLKISLIVGEFFQRPIGHGASRERRGYGIEAAYDK